MATERQMIVETLIDYIDPRDSSGNRTYTGLIANPNPPDSFAQQVEDSDYSILAKGVAVTAELPAKLDSNSMPYISYRYITGGLNEENAPSVQLTGESIIFTINVTFEKFNDDGLLMVTSARWHDTMSMLAANLRNVLMVEGLSIRDVNLSGVVPFEVDVSSREHLGFVIEIQWAYLDRGVGFINPP